MWWNFIFSKKESGNGIGDEKEDIDSVDEFRFLSFKHKQSNS